MLHYLTHDLQAIGPSTMFTNVGLQFPDVSRAIWYQGAGYVTLVSSTDGLQVLGRLDSLMSRMWVEPPAVPEPAGCWQFRDWHCGFWPSIDSIIRADSTQTQSRQIHQPYRDRY